MIDDNKLDDIDPKIVSEIQKQFTELLNDSGVEIDENYVAELENYLGFGLSELSDEIETMYMSKVLKVQKIHEDAVFPKYAYPSDSGFDLHSTETLTIDPFGRALVPTGLKFEFDENFELQVRPKSGLALKLGLTVLNTPGTVDQGYTDEVKVIVFNTNNVPVTIEKGMKVAQAVLCPVMNGKYVIIEEIKQVSDKDRGNNGFGSTGLK